MFVLILGSGRVGSTIARTMLQAGHEVSVLDEDPLSHERLDAGMDSSWEEAGGAFTLGTALEVDALLEAGIDRADVFVAATDGDNTNLVVAQIDVLEISLCAGASLAGLLLGGIHGAVLGQALGSALTLLLSVHWARTRLGFGWPATETLKVLAATGVMALSLLAWRPPTTALGLAEGVVIGGLAYGVALAALFWADLRRLVQAQRA